MTGESLGKKNAIPTKVRITTVRSEGNLVKQHVEEVSITCQKDPDDESECLWKMHPTYGAKVDVVALPLPENFQYAPEPLDLDKPHHANHPELIFDISVPDRVVIIGYPRGIDGGTPWAGVWMQGNIASEFGIGHGGLPKFLVDSRTRTGMSGSPVYFYPRGQRAYFTDGSYDYLNPDASIVIGVYSGRTDSESDLGTVWRISLVREILESGVPGLPYL